MGESGSLVQAAGTAAFLSPEMGEQQSRNVPWREKRPKQRERNRQEGTRRKKGGELDDLLREALNGGTDSFIK